MTLPFDWFILLLRVIFVFLLYFFLFQIARTIARELRAVSISTAGARAPTAPEMPRVPARLVLEETTEAGLPAGTTYELRPGTVVGRRQSSDIWLNDTYMSSEHARLTIYEGRWWIADLGSTNGTFVNNARVDRPTALTPGAEVRFGRIRLRFTG